MTKYFCICCRYNAKQKSNFDKHIKTKNHKIREELYLENEKLKKIKMMHPKSVDIDPCNPKVDDNPCLQSNKFGLHMHPNASNSVDINNEDEIKNSITETNNPIRDKDNRFVCGYCFKSYKYRMF